MNELLKFTEVNLKLLKFTHLFNLFLFVVVIFNLLLNGEIEYTLHFSCNLLCDFFFLFYCFCNFIKEVIYIQQNEIHDFDKYFPFDNMDFVPNVSQEIGRDNDAVITYVSEDSFGCRAI